MTGPRIRCEPLDIEIEALPGETIFDALRRAGVPIGSACDGDGICGRCGVEVLEGPVSEATEAELRVARKNRVAAGARLSCCATPLGDLRVTTPYW